MRPSSSSTSSVANTQDLSFRLIPSRQIPLSTPGTTNRENTRHDPQTWEGTANITGATAVNGPATTEFTARRALLTRASLILREAAAGLNINGRMPIPNTRAMTLSQYQHAIANQNYSALQAGVTPPESAPLTITNNAYRQYISQTSNSDSRQQPPSVGAPTQAANTTLSAFQDYLDFHRQQQRSSTLSTPQTNSSTTRTSSSSSASTASTLRPNNRNTNASQATTPNGSIPPPANMHPSFRSKIVCQLSCGYCIQPICKRGMKAILLADTRVELYSTDTVPAGRVQLVAEDYLTRNCNCKIRDVACLGCGNVIGYHVTQPCDVCMSACNNGHFWMFHDDSISSLERLDPAGQKTLMWSQIPFADKDLTETRDQLCR